MPYHVNNAPSQVLLAAYFKDFFLSVRTVKDIFSFSRLFAGGFSAMLYQNGESSYLTHPGKFEKFFPS